MLKVKDLSISFQKTIFDHVTVELPCGHLIAIKGESGSGKSTFLRFIMNEVNYRSGELYYQDKLIDENSRDDFLFNHVSYIDQMGSYYPNMTIKQHFEFYAKLHGMQVNTDDILKCFEYVHLECKKLKQSPSRLSTGERKRFLIALALFLHKDIILLDEPTASLDQKSQKYLLETLKQLKNEGMTIIMTTHDEDLVEASDSVYEIKDCQINQLKESQTVSIRHELNEKEPQHIKYRKYKNTKLKILFIFIALIGSLAISLMSQSISLTASVSKVQTKEVNSLQNNNLYFYKMYRPDMNIPSNLFEFAFWNDELDVVKQEDIDKIKNIDGVKDVKPLVRLDKMSQNTLIKVFQNDDELKVINTELYDKTTDSVASRNLYVLGYYPEDKVAKYCHNGTYINNVLKEMIAEESLDNMSLQILLGNTFKYEEGYNPDKYQDEMISFHQNKDVMIPIDGVVDQSVYIDEYYLWNAVIYMPVDQLTDLIKDNYDETTDESRQYIVYCEDGKDMDVKLAIEEMSELYIAENDRTSFAGMVDYIQEQNTNSHVTTAIVSLVLFMGVLLLIFYYQSLRKTEMIYMKREGLSQYMKSYYREDMIGLLVIWLIVSVIMMIIYKKLILIIHVSDVVYIASWLGSTIVVGLILYCFHQFCLKRMIGRVMCND